MIRALLAATALASLAFMHVPALAQDAADNYVRVNRLENQVRQLAGQIEQLQFANKRLQDQLQKFQEDVEFRFQERGGAKPAPRPAASPSATPQRRSDLFDPSADPSAPGAPQVLGRTTPSEPLRPAELDQMASRQPRSGSLADPPGGVQVIDGEDEGVGTPLDLNSLSRTGSVSAVEPRGVTPVRPSIAATDQDAPGSGYETAVAMIQQRQYEGAEMALRQFLQSHPRDPRAGDATYLLGESYFQRGRYEEAGQQYLKVSTEHPRAARAPEALLKLGMSLNAIGAKEQACATFAKAGRDYPQAGETVRRGIDRERAKARCTA